MTFNLLKGLKRGMIYGESISYLGKSVLYSIGIITMYMFWVFLAIYHSKNFFSMSVLMIMVIRLGVILLIFGVLFYYLSYFIHEIIFKKKLKSEEKKVVDTINSKTINELLETE